MSEERFLLAYKAWVDCGRPGDPPQQFHYGVDGRDLRDKIAELDKANPQSPESEI